MKITGQHVDDQRFNHVVNILMGRMSIGIPTAQAHAEAKRVAYEAFVQIQLRSAAIVDHATNYTKARKGK